MSEISSQQMALPSPCPAQASDASTGNPQLLKEPLTAQPAVRDQSSLNAHYRGIGRALEKMKLGYSHLCFVKGRPGIGKSFQIRRHLEELGMEYVEIAGHTSEAYLYRILCEHSGKVIWLKDVARLLKGLRSIDLLKSACETTPKRLVTNMNYSEKQLDLPKRFYFTGKIIFDFNSLAGLRFREDFEALASRGDFIDLIFSHGETCEIMRQICRTREEREVTEFLIQNYRYCGHNALNLRTQRQALQTVKYARRRGLEWQREVRQELRYQRSAVQKLLYPILGDGPRRSLEVKKYLVKTQIVATMRTADRRIADWLELGEVHRTSWEHRNFLISLMPLPLPGQSPRSVVKSGAKRHKRQSPEAGEAVEDQRP